MLEEPTSFEVLLVSPIREPLWRMRGEPIGCVQFAKGQTKRVLISVEILVVEIGVFIEPERQAQRRPAAPFVHDDLTALVLRFRRDFEAATSPDRRGLSGTAEVGPE